MSPMKIPRVRLRLVLLTCGLLLAAGCSAHNEGDTKTAASPVAPAAAQAARFTAGNQYVRMSLPEGQAAPTGPVEVVEVFSYGCPHCAEFAPYMDKLRGELPQGVTVRYLPAVFGPQWVPYAQAYYAAERLGVVKQTHDAVFQALLQHYPLNSIEDLAAFYARHGVDEQKFLAAATDEQTQRQLDADRLTELRWGVVGTPTLVVGRRASDAADAPFVALLRSNDISSYEELQALGLWMAQEAAKG